MTTIDTIMYADFSDSTYSCMYTTIGIYQSLYTQNKLDFYVVSIYTYYIEAMEVLNETNKVPNSKKRHNNLF